LLWFAAVLALIYLAVFCYRSVSWPKTGIKTLSVLLLAVIAWQTGASGWLIAALSLCALGDFLLSREDEQSFLAGVGAFALGHVAYIILFLGTPGADIGRLVAAPQAFITGALVIFAAVMARLLLPRAGGLAGPVLAYIPIICGMGIAAVALPFGGQWSWVFPGALLFMLSDFVLAMEMFVLPKSVPMRRFTPFIIWLTYWGAQFSLFSSFV
jgi:uncharacterized membrane protein YhhN